MKVSILGSGSSGGVPVVGVGWGACDPDNRKNRRTRPCVLLEVAGKTYLFDTSPDLRQQLLSADIRHLDGVFFTHAHADHLNGLDDLRGINRAMHAPLDIYCDQQTLKAIKDRFNYALTPLAEGASHYYKPVLVPTTICAGETFRIDEIDITVFDQDHGFSRTLGYRIGNFGYSTDLVNLPEAGFEVLAGVHTWIIGSFTNHAHGTHVHVAKALEWIDRLKPKRAILSHLGPNLDYGVLSAELPEGVFAAYDGMAFDVPD